MAASVAFILKGYPRLSETFIAQEIRALEAAGLDIRIWSLRHPTDPAAHPIHAEIAAPVRYLPEYLHQEPRRVLEGWRRARRLPGYRRARAAFLADLRRDFTPNRARRFGQALVLAAELPPETGRLHAHFLHTPASVARYAALMTGLPWSCSAHAKDIWTTPAWEKREKLAALDWIVTCTAAGRAHLADLAADPARVALVYHGLDFGRFPAPDSSAGGARQGRDATDRVEILSVGRAVPKKGYAVLLAALAALPPDLHWRLTHIGGGPLAGELKAEAVRRGIAERISWLGAQPQGRVLEALRRSDLFVLASRIADDGDRDGMPNVLMEAMSQGVAVVATDLPGIAELVRDGESGRLVPPNDAPALADALAVLIRDPARRARLGRAGFDRLHREFDMAAGIRTLARRFGLADAALADAS
ncbi:MAG: glycosyltransferase family 4 protein [Dongiaceae bacterium]